ncbi:unnamed protein product [Parnassius mnemosyne]
MGDLKKSSYLVCSAHFEDTSFKIIKHLKEHALPSMLLHNQPQEGPSISAQVKDKVTILSNNKEYVTVETQTEALRSTKEQTQKSKALTEGTPRKRKISIEIRECNLKRQKLDQEIKNKIDNLTTSIADDQSNLFIKKEPEAEEWVQMTDPEDVVIPDTSNAKEHFSSSEYEESLECELPKPLAFNNFAKKRKLEDFHNESLAVTLRDINTQLHVLTNQRYDCFDNFGKYISAMLRIMPIQKSMELQPKIVALITSVGVSNNEGRISQSHENCS